MMTYVKPAGLCWDCGTPDHQHREDCPTRTLGKTVTLPLGAVVTDIGHGRRNGRDDPGIRRCRGDDGYDYLIVARVIRELPPTIRRATLPDSIYHPSQLEGLT